MRTQEQDQPGRERTIRGVVNGNGTVYSGTGFTVTKTGVGTYTVYYTTPFRAPPTTALSLAQNAAGIVVLGGGATPNILYVATANLTGAAADFAFQFISRGIA